MRGVIAVSYTHLDVYKRQPMNIPKCDQIAWSMFGLSMANYNMILSILLAIWSCICALRGDTGANSFNDSKEDA